MGRWDEFRRRREIPTSYRQACNDIPHLRLSTIYPYVREPTRLSLARRRTLHQACCRGRSSANKTGRPQGGSQYTQYMLPTWSSLLAPSAETGTPTPASPMIGATSDWRSRPLIGLHCRVRRFEPWRGTRERARRATGVRGMRAARDGRVFIKPVHRPAPSPSGGHGFALEYYSGSCCVQTLLSRIVVILNFARAANCTCCRSA